MCLNTNSCWAVGESGDGGSVRPLIERYTDAGWAIAASPGLPGGTGALNAVSCAGPQDCWAVGTAGSDGAARPLIERYDGSAWSIVPGALTTGSLTGVSCMAAGSCWAVGHTGATPPLSVLEHFDGSRWTTPAPPQAVFLDAVSCRSAEDCWVVGSTATGAPLVERWLGSSWVVTASDAEAHDGRLAAVTCTAGGTCWAVGATRTAAGVSTLAERYTGAGWSLTATPRPPFSSTSSLTGVACATDVECWAVGTAEMGGSTQGTAETYDGTAWTVARTGAATLAGSSLTSVTCPEDDDCWVVGTCDVAASSACHGSASLIELYDLILPDGH